MRNKTSIIGAIALIVLTVALAAGAMSASAARDDLDSRLTSTAGAVLVGSWDVTLTLPGPSTARVFATFDGDGGTVESAAVPGTLRGVSHGAWERIERRLFAVTRVFFRFDQQTGAYLGTQKVNATVRVASDGETFTAVSISELRNPAGNVILSGLPGTAVGTRIHVERIPDQP